MELTNEQREAKLKALRAPFPANQISVLPKPYRRDSEKGRCPECGGWHGLPAAHLSYIGHAALTARLLDVDPDWTWEPVAVDQFGNPKLDETGGLWIRLTVCGVTRLGYGDATNQQGGNAMKERIGDALRNAGMRFGIALELWHKGELYLAAEDAPELMRHAPEQPWTAQDIHEAIGAMRSAQSFDDLKAIFAAMWPRASEQQRAELQPEYENAKASLPTQAPAPAQSAPTPARFTPPGAPDALPLGTRQPRSRNKTTTH